MSCSYLLIRFEELVEDPLAIAEELYDFIGGEDVPELVREWIEKSGNKVLDTHANAVEYADKWNSNYTKRVEEECKTTDHQNGTPVPGT